MLFSGFHLTEGFLVKCGFHWTVSQNLMGVANKSKSSQCGRGSEISSSDKVLEEIYKYTMLLTGS